MRKFLASLALAFGAANAANADIITQWTFEGDVITPSSGTGTASLVGGTTATFAAGSSGGRGWNSTTYAAQGTGSGTRGVEFLTSTAGYQDITVSYDHRASGTASRWSQLLYTLDGGANWLVFGDNGGGVSPHDTFFPQAFDLSPIGGADNNPNFGIRVVSIFSPIAFDTNDTVPANREIYGANEAYHRARVDGGTGGVYGSGGTWRFDNVTINGTLIPEPGALLLLGLGALAMFRRR